MLINTWLSKGTAGDESILGTNLFIYLWEDSGHTEEVIQLKKPSPLHGSEVNFPPSNLRTPFRLAAHWKVVLKYSLQTMIV